MAFTYIGDEKRGYIAYLDDATHRMLIAEPGEAYEIGVTEPGIPIPPTDGRWLTEDGAIAEPVSAAVEEPASEPEAEAADKDAEPPTDAEQAPDTAPDPEPTPEPTTGAESQEAE